MTCLDCKDAPTKLCDYHRLSSSNLDDERDVEIERLRTALLKYGTHLATCATFRRKEYTLCDCGLGEVLA